jgi:hypothetical protein
MLQLYRRVDDDLRRPYFQKMMVELNHQDRRLLALRMPDDMANHLGVVLHRDHLFHLVLLVVLQNLDVLNLVVPLPFLDEHHLELDALLVVKDVVLVDVALADEESHRLRMDYFRHVVDVEGLIRHHLSLERLVLQKDPVLQKLVLPPLLLD